VETLSFAIRLWLALVCLTAALGKARGYRAFVDSVELIARAVPLISAPAMFARRSGRALVTAELLLAVLLPWPDTAVAGSALALGLFGALSVGVGVSVATGAAAPCACFGRISQTLSGTHVLRNLLLTAAAGAGLAITLAAGTGFGPGPGLLPATVAAGVASMVISHWTDLTAVLRPPVGVSSARETAR
jgi:hypothetical protein